jgi:hypothetical protein
MLCYVTSYYVVTLFLSKHYNQKTESRKLNYSLQALVTVKQMRYDLYFTNVSVYATVPYL